MSEKLTFHFEGALADSHRMNFYEAARFQYAAARLIVKLAQFRKYGKFVQKITNNTNFEVELVSQSDGSFNINVETPEQVTTSDQFVTISIADLVAYVSERLIEKIDESAISNMVRSYRTGIVDTGLIDTDPVAAIDGLVSQAMADRAVTADLPIHVQELIRRRVAESYREQRLAANQGAIARIDVARSQKLIAMSAPLVSEMATALRKSANTLEIESISGGEQRSVLFLDRRMAQDIETAIVDKDITPILGDVIQFNKDNGWGKVKIESGSKVLNFSIPADILPVIKQQLINSMNRDLVYIQLYYVRDKADQIMRAIIVGVLPPPQ